MNRRVLAAGCALIVVFVSAPGCNSPYHADRGALFGGLTGAGVGAIVGNATGNTGAGAAIGAGVGALTGAAVGGSLDEIEARNRAEIAAQLGGPIREGAVTIPDVVNMTRSGVSERLIVTHIQHNGVAAPLKTPDLIYLQQQGVSENVIQAMQAPPIRQVSRPLPPPGAPVIIEEHYYGPPPMYYRPHWHGHHHHHHRRPRTSWGFSFSG